MGISSTVIADLANEVTIQTGSIISRTIHQDDFLKVVLFGFDAGQELSEHTAGVPAVLQFLSGEATVTLGDTVFEASTNSFIHMDAKLPHSIRAHQPTKMLLIILKGAKTNE
jgi:quercetin dioxygenase-like cupin family protein